MYTNNKSLADAADKKKVVVAAHRGTCGGNVICNTTLAYQNALLHGADMIEIDVSMTADGIFYAFHNTEEKVVFGKECDIRRMWSQEVEEINLLNSIQNTSGQRVERLADLLPRFKGKCLINIDRSWFYWEKVISFLKSMDMEDQILLKCGVEDIYLQQLADSKAGIMYMPIVRTVEEWEQVKRYDLNVAAAELIFTDVKEPLADQNFLEELRSQGILPWVNAITLNDQCVLSGGLDDNGAIGEGFDKHWGTLMDMGFQIIQTDWPGLLKNYVKQKYHL
ncbi:MAG: glycerophosphodiester phosphodiesterase family protein [Lachnospiraceae bacterium]|nr:glycerophosphodiester phosphodiesterase family protein [Lachnospiraceae bacterium]